MIDDSADRDRDKVIISAALFATQKEWQGLQAAWRKRLNQDGIEYFKSSHCRHLRGQFFKFNDDEKFPKPLGRETADQIQSDLDQIIRTFQVFGVGAVIPVSLWKKFQSDPIYSPVCSKDPYHWAVQTVWVLCASAMQELGRGNVIGFAHDKCQNFRVLSELYREYKKKNVTSRRVFAGFGALDDKTHPPIQAADVVASVTHTYAVEWLNDPTGTNLRRLESSMYRISIWDERFANLVLENELKKRGKRV